MTERPDQFGDDRGIDVIRSEERLAVGVDRRPVEVVRLRKRIVTETRMVEVAVRREELVVERRPAADGLAGGGLDGGELVLTLSEEVPVVTTSVRPVERVRVRIERATTEESVSAELRREQIEVDTGADRPGGQRG